MPGPVFGSTGDVTYIAKLNTLSAALLTNEATQSANFTAVRGWRYPVDTDAITVTLPLAPAATDTVAAFTIASAAKKITFARNGQNIEGAAADKVITKDGFHYMAVFVSAGFGWKIFDLTTAPAASRRNLVINGNFDVAQRAITYNLTTAVAYGSVDRWGFKMAGTANGIAYQSDAQAVGFVGFKNCLRLGRNAGSALTGVISAQTAFETSDSVKWQGKNAALTLAIKAGANFSGANLVVKLFSGKGADQSLVSMEAGTWTASATPISVNQAITNVATDYTFTATLPTDITQLGLQFSYAPVGTAGADDSVYITGVDISEGTTAAPREFRPIPVEFEICERFYQQVGKGAGGGWHSATQAAVGAAFRTAMRAVPTLALTTTAPVVAEVGVAVRTAAAAALATYNNPITQFGWVTLVSGFAAATATNVALMDGDYITASAEL
jgi:hypothetical protein